MDLNIFLKVGATSKFYGKNEIIFEEGSKPRYFHIVVSGKVEMFFLSEEGKDFTQGFFSDNDTFGEPPLFLNLPYPASARAKIDTEVLRLSKEKFLALVDSNPELKSKFLVILARRIYSKSLGLSSLANCEPEKRILLFINKYRFDNDIEENIRTVLPYTRQELANITGLRIETVIRALSKMKKRGTLNFLNKKVVI